MLVSSTSKGRGVAKLHRVSPQRLSRDTTMSDSKMFWAALAFVLMGIGVSGCNTTEGFGEDMQSAGEAIEEEAEEAN